MADSRSESVVPMKPTTASPATTPKIRWDDSNMKSSYANVCNVSFTREEVVLMFGINQAWNREQQEVAVQLTDRIILSPFAAKRLAGLLAGAIREYEARFPALEVEARRPGEAAASK
jgi:hypothetical protein